MECKREYFRFFVETLRRNDVQPTEIHNYLVTAWNDSAPSLRTIRRYYHDLTFGARQSFLDSKRSGRLKSASTNQNITYIRNAIQNDCHITIDQLTSEISVSHGTIHNIIKCVLKKKFVCSRYVAHNLTDSNKRARVQKAQEWLQYFQNHEDEVHKKVIVIDEKWFYLRSIGTKASNKCWIDKSGIKPKIIRRQQQDTKCLCIVAISFTGKFCIEVLNPFQTMDSQVYVHFLQRMMKNFKRQVLPLYWDDAVLIFDNARPHLAQETVTLLHRKNVTILHQPPYSPDFNLCDRYIFSELEKGRISQNFTNKEELEIYLSRSMKSLHSEQLARQLTYLKNDLSKIIQNNGDYI